MSKLIVIVIAACLGVSVWMNSAPERAARAQAEADAKAAIELRCEAGEISADSQCVEVLTQKFASGSSTPEAILRTHCTKWAGPFVVVKEKPPKLCVDRFGGWLSS